MKNVFTVDWCNLEQVKQVADAMAMHGKPQIVIKHCNQSNYNVTFESRKDRYEENEVVYRTHQQN